MKKKKTKKQKKKEVKQKQKLYLTYENRVALKVAGSILSFVLCALFIILSLKININTNLRYYQTSNLDYKVNLKENNYYSERQLSKNMQYIASLIDNIDVDFNYDFKTSEKIDYTYSYYINAEVKVRDDSTSNVIFSRKEMLLDEKTYSMKESDSFNINRKVKLDYEKYNNMVKNFKSEYALSAKSDLTLTLFVRIMDEEGNEFKKVNTNNQMTMVIPLTEQTVNIKMDYKDVNNSDTFVTHTDLKINNKVLFGIGLAFGALFVVELLRLFIFLGKLSKKKTPYDKALSKLLREYDRIIVESKKDIIIDSEQDQIEVKSFEELLDARDNLEKPILFKEIHKGQKAMFVVKNNYEVYKYVLKAVDLEKPKK